METERIYFAIGRKQMQRHFSSMLHTLMWAQCWMAGTCDGGDLHQIKVTKVQSPYTIIIAATVLQSLHLQEYECGLPCHAL